MAGVEKILAAVQAADDATSFPDNECSGSHVPYTQARFPEGVETAGCHVTQIERSCADPANAAGIDQHGVQHIQVRLQRNIGVTKRKAGADQCPLEGLLLAYANTAAIQLRALAARGREEFLSERIVDRAVL